MSGPANRRHNPGGVATRSYGGRRDGPGSNGEAAEKNMWSSMLDSVASGKKLPEKNILVLGGTSEIQKEFLELLAPESLDRLQERHKRKPPVANEFALGYTYQDVLDTDHEDTLARLSIYFLSEPSPAFSPLIKPLLTARTVPHTLAVLILDWAEPWRWVRQLRDWILFLKQTISSLDEEIKDIMATHMKKWQQRRGGGVYDAGGGTGSEGGVATPLGQGEWDEGLGIPLCVVCHNASQIEVLENEQGWREEEFDFILQFLRTILMKHGASLVYTSVSVPNSLPTLIHSMLGVYSPLRKQILKHNVVDRDKILIPPNWDSWGKIRVLRDGFDVEGTSIGWSIDVQQSPPSLPSTGGSVAGNEDTPTASSGSREKGLVLPTYEHVIKDPSSDGDADPATPNHKVEIETVNTQEFLARQLEIMERLKVEEEKSQEAQESRAPPDRPSLGKGSNAVADRTKLVDEHIGPVQFNFGGIQVDSDGISKKPNHQPEPISFETDGQSTSTPGGKTEKVLQSFFEHLMQQEPKK
ncbi:hypothetical protein MMC07_005451 [Pseudocyphellaria aurata]|nr:hypothetical protein [Pseudocyphellaria aurata]